mmetsp:Transcript_119617/g.333799  ORF Transcript_119617/g.333799 Transcript_119617/m.333799 type:complete len:271 (-) Transcript_119617:119-931(-)
MPEKRRVSFDYNPPQVRIMPSRTASPEQWRWASEEAALQGDYAVARGEERPSSPCRFAKRAEQLRSRRCCTARPPELTQPICFQDPLESGIMQRRRQSAIHPVPPPLKRQIRAEAEAGGEVLPRDSGAAELGVQPKELPRAGGTPAVAVRSGARAGADEASGAAEPAQHWETFCSIAELLVRLGENHKVDAGVKDSNPTAKPEAEPEVGPCEQNTGRDVEPAVMPTGQRRAGESAGTVVRLGGPKSVGAAQPSACQEGQRTTSEVAEPTD